MGLKGRSWCTLAAAATAAPNKCMPVMAAATPPKQSNCRKFERFFEHFHEFDNIVVATFPTCHDPTLRELLRLRLPQRIIAMVRVFGG